MYVGSQPERFLVDGDPVTQLTVEDSRFERVAVRRLDDGIEVRAEDSERDEIIELQAQLTDKLYKGIELTDSGYPSRRRHIEDDLHEIIQLVGYTLVEDDVARYSAETATAEAVE